MGGGTHDAPMRFLALLLAALLASSAAAQTLDKIRKTGAITFGYIDGAAPFSSVDANGEPQGYSVDLCRAVAESVAQQLKRIGIGLPSSIDVNRMNVRFVLIDSADLKSIQTYTKILDQLAWVLPLLALLLYGIAIAIAPKKRAAVARTGIGITP